METVAFYFGFDSISHYTCCIELDVPREGAIEHSVCLDCFKIAANGAGKEKKKQWNVKAGS